MRRPRPCGRPHGSGFCIPKHKRRRRLPGAISAFAFDAASIGRFGQIVKQMPLILCALPKKLPGNGNFWRFCALFARGRGLLRGQGLRPDAARRAPSLEMGEVHAHAAPQKRSTNGTRAKGGGQGIGIFGCSQRFGGWQRGAPGQFAQPQPQPPPPFLRARTPDAAMAPSAASSASSTKQVGRFTRDTPFDGLLSGAWAWEALAGRRAAGKAGGGFCRPPGRREGGPLPRPAGLTARRRPAGPGCAPRRFGPGGPAARQSRPAPPGRPGCRGQSRTRR